MCTWVCNTDRRGTGLINNVLYVIILSAAQDLVGNVPKGELGETANEHISQISSLPVPSN